jgi:hypothetical protein
MGDCHNGDLRLDFDRTLKLKVLGSQVTTDAGLLAYRELDGALRLTEVGAESLQDSRLGQNKQTTFCLCSGLTSMGKTLPPPSRKTVSR